MGDEVVTKTAKIRATVVCAALTMAPSAACQAAHNSSSSTQHHKLAEAVRAQTAKPYGASLTEEEALRALEVEISRKLGAKIQESDYPEEARRQGWTGTTLVGVEVGANGKIIRVSLSQTSGFRLLDQQALRMVEGVRIWWIPQRLRKRTVQVAVPVAFFIRNVESGNGSSAQAASALSVSRNTPASEHKAWKFFPGADTSGLYRRTERTLEFPTMSIVVDALFPRADDDSCNLFGPEKI